MVAASYLADPLGAGLLPLRFGVPEATEQGLGRRALLSILVFPQAPSGRTAASAGEEGPRGLRRKSRAASPKYRRQRPPGPAALPGGIPLAD